MELQRYGSDNWIRRLRWHRGKSISGAVQQAVVAERARRLHGGIGETGSSSGPCRGRCRRRRRFRDLFGPRCLFGPGLACQCRLLRRLRRRRGRGTWRCRGFNADHGRGSKQRDGNEKDSKKSAAAAGSKGLAEAGFVEQALNALGKMTGAGHGNSCKGWARESREFKQELSVGRAAGGHFKAGAIADCLAQFREFAFEPPSQGTEPEEGSIEAGE